MNNTQSLNTNNQEENPFEALANAKTLEEKELVLDKVVNSMQHEKEQLIAAIQQLNKEAAHSPNDESAIAHLTESIFKYVRLTNVSSGGQLASSVHALDQVAVNDARKRLLTEFAPTSASEELVIDQALNAYFRSLRLSQAHLSMIQDSAGNVRKWDNQLIINLIKEIGKQASFANQQFMTAITYLKESKQPPIKIRVNPKVAFVAQNQQFNKNA